MKTKLIVFLIMPFYLKAIITHEQFLQLNNDQAWQVYSTHIENYRRIFNAKNEEISRLENANSTWKAATFVSTLVASISLLMVAGLMYKFPRLPRE